MSEDKKNLPNPLYLKNLLDHVADPIFVKNRKHQWIDGNKAFWDLMGGPKEKFTGLSDYDIFPKEEADTFWENDDKVFNTGESSINEEFLTDREGKRHIISTKKVLFINDNGEQVLVGIIRDITAEKQLEDLKAKSMELRFETMANAMPAMVWMADANRQCYFFNDAWLDFTGRNMEEEKGYGWIGDVHPEDLSRCLKIYEEAFDDRRPFEIVYRLKRRDGVYRYILNKAQPNYNIFEEFEGYSGACIDITETMDAERTMKEGELRLRAIHNQAAIGFVQTDLAGNIMTVNPRFCEIVGRFEHDLINTRLLELSHMDDRRSKSILLEYLLKTGKAFSIEKRYVRPSGEIVWTSNEVSLVSHATGEPWLIMAVVQDITERKRAQEALKQKELQYQNIFESTKDAIVVFDNNGRVVETNPEASRIYGYSYEEFKEITGNEFTPIEHSKKFTNFMNLTRQGKNYFAESIHLRKDGTPIYVEINGGAFNFGGKFHVMAMIRDITERKQAEEKLARISEQSDRLRRIYETALSNTADFNYIFDLKGNFIYMNKPLLDLWHLKPEDVRGKTFLDMGYDPEIAKQIHTEIQQVIETKQPLKGTNSFTNKKGARVYEYIFQPVMTPDGKVQAVAGSTRDISELILADKRKDEFIAMLAHELRNPLAPIRNSVDVITRTEDEKLQSEAVHTIERQLDHMVHLVDDLLDVSRISQNKIELRREDISLQNVLAHAVETAQPLIQKLKHKLNVNIPEEPIYLNADFSRISQIFSNLLNNAAKYTDKGGTIELNVKRAGAHIIVSVKDNGIGINPEMLSSIFDMFSQIDSSLERTHGGLGIGLTLVKKMVEMHGGNVEARSGGANKGTEFIVTLPVLPASTSKAQKQENKPASAASTDKANHYKVLIVDDNEASAKTMGWAMELYGHDVKLAHDGLKAIEAAKEYKPDVILLDIGLPGMNGYDVCAALRNDPELRNAKIIAQTGWGQKEHLERSKQAGFDNHLVKPIDIKELMKIISGLNSKAA